jgi:hypothetical protein
MGGKKEKEGRREGMQEGRNQFGKEGICSRHSILQ